MTGAVDMNILLNTVQCDATEYVRFPVDDIVVFHRRLPGYQPTPLVSLESAAKKLGVGRLLVKGQINLKNRKF